MRQALLALALLVATLPAWAADYTTPEAAAKLVGSTLNVRGKCVQASQSSKGDIYLNFGAPYPNQSFYAFIAAKDIETLGGHKFLLASEGHTITIQGTVVAYKDKPNIILTQPTQLAK